MNDKVILGRFGAVYGVRGWLRVVSFTQPLENILDYPNWQVQHLGTWKTVTIEAGKLHGKGIVVKLKDVDDREQAQTYTRDNIAIDSEALPELTKDEHYWKDLIDMSVITKDGVILGTVKNLLETGANDVLIVTGDRERMIPYTTQTIQSIDTEKKTIIVDWDPDF